MKFTKHIFAGLVLSLGAAALGSCTGDLDQQPQIGVTSGTVYSTVQGYESVMAKIYGSYSLIGQSKAGQADLSSYAGHDLLRSYFNLQEGTTDEAAFRWLSGDNLWSLPFMNWDNSCPQVSDTYYRLYYNIALCNEFLRYCDDGSLGRFNEADRAKLSVYALEARFMRALSYYLVLDLFRQGPFVNEATPTSGVMPEAYNAAQLMEFIESEINAIAPGMADRAPYARAGKGAAYALLARLYLNSEAYGGQPRWTDCIGACKKVMALGYSLEPDYLKLFNADNNLRENEIIFPSQTTPPTPPPGAPVLTSSAAPSGRTTPRTPPTTASPRDGATSASTVSSMSSSPEPKATHATPSSPTDRPSTSTTPSRTAPRDTTPASSPTSPTQARPPATPPPTDAAQTSPSSVSPTYTSWPPRQQSAEVRA